MSNQRQLMLIVNFYVLDYEKLPLSNPSEESHWPLLLEAYDGVVAKKYEGLLRCPERVDPGGLKAPWYWGSDYAINYFLTHPWADPRVGSPVNPANIPGVGSYVFFADLIRDETLGVYPGFGWYFPDVNEITGTSRWSYRHEERINLSFLDGHVENWKRELAEAGFQDGKLKVDPAYKPGGRR